LEHKVMVYIITIIVVVFAINFKKSHMLQGVRV
jgi:hypothetical protein